MEEDIELVGVGRPHSDATHGQHLDVSSIGKLLRWRKRLGSSYKEYAYPSEAPLIAESATGVSEIYDTTGELFWVLANTEISDEEAKQKISKLIARGAQVNFYDEANQGTPLYCAVLNKWVSVCQCLLEAGANPLDERSGVSPFRLAIKDQNDDIASMMLVYIPNRTARGLFLAGEKEAQFSFHDLFANNMKKTIWSLLDNTMDPEEEGRYRLWYNVLEVDDVGRTPADANFDNTALSISRTIMQSKNKKEFLHHDVVRHFIETRWNMLFRKLYLAQGALYMVATICLTYAVVLACGTEDPAIYDSSLQCSRAVAESIAYIIVLLRFGVEIRQVFVRRLSYFRDPFSLTDVLAVVSLLAVIPLRFTRQPAQWPVYAVGYFFWYIRMFHYAVVFRLLSIYVQILWRIITHDLYHFAIVFIVVLFGFAGTMLLATRLDRVENTSVSFHGLLFDLARTLFESGPTVDYTEDGNAFGNFGIFVMCLYLFVCIVMMSNILIAQITATFQRKWDGAEREHYLNMTWMITRVEYTSPFLPRHYRKKYYKEFIDVDWKKGEEQDGHERQLQEIQDSLALTEMRMHTVEDNLRKITDAIQQISGNVSRLKSS